MIINILICDDNPNDLLNLKKNIDRFFFQLPESFDYHIDECTSGESLLSMCSENVYHALFLDIELPGINGLEAAKKLRKSNNSIIIIFVTSYDQFMRDSFEVQPYQYLEKPIHFESAKKVCQSIIQTISNNHSSILAISTANGNILINIHDLAYIQSVKGKKNLLEFHLKNREIHYTNGTILAWENELKDYGFIFSRRGVLVNINLVHIITNDQVILKNNETLPLSRRQAKTFHDTFVNHVISIFK